MPLILSTPLQKQHKINANRVFSKRTHKSYAAKTTWLKWPQVQVLLQFQDSTHSGIHLF